MEEINYNKGQQITILSLVCNLILSILKISFGIVGKSKGLFADGINSISDVATNVIVLIGIKVAKKPKDLNHPYGHGKVEPLTALIVGFILIVASFSILSEVYSTIKLNVVSIPSSYTLIVSAISLITKEILFRKTMQEGKKINSEALIANAWDHRSDVYTSLGTFFGIACSIYSTKSDIVLLKYADSIAAIFVALIILRISITISTKAIKGLMDSSPDIELIDSIKCIIYTIDGIKTIRSINGRYLGQYLQFDIVIAVDPEMSVLKAHIISIEIEELIESNFDRVREVMVHIEPYENINC